MRLLNKTLIFSATDLVNYLGCRHSTYLDVLDQRAPVATSGDEPFLDLLQAKGLAHERAYLKSLQDRGRRVVELTVLESGAERTQQTREAMAAGAEVIYQGALQADRWQGYADFLIRVPGNSALGDFHYEAVDTKLSGIAKPSHALQLAVYARLLAQVQGRLPNELHIVLGDEQVTSVRTADLYHYAEVARQGLEAFAAELPASSVGEPCAHCASCRWNTRCEQEWAATDQLSLVAGITKGQRAKLNAAGVTTLSALAKLPGETRIPGLQADTFAKIRSQAALQATHRSGGGKGLEVLPNIPGKGFGRLPKPDRGDLFFDMEGDPLFKGGLEYLFGVVDVVGGKPRFTPFWGHDRAKEKQAFERVMDFIGKQLERFPNAHVYHYAAYEESALKRLAMLHGTRESAVDDLLRTGKLVDLYQVVRESIRVSEPRYSIKNLEKFYMETRAGEVTDAGASVVVYERWRQLRDPRLLQELADYNEFDCVSTWKLRDWLLTLRPNDTVWHEGPKPNTIDPDRQAKRMEAERRSSDVQARLRRGPEQEAEFRELVGHLLEFHRREAKPAWWAMFARQQMAEEELIDDAECIGALRADPTAPAYADKRSTVHTFRFPPQDCKMRAGDRPKRSDTLKDAGEIVFLNDELGHLSLKVGPKSEPLPMAFSLIPSGPFDTTAQREAIYRYAESLIDEEDAYRALRSILMKAPPRIEGLAPGLPMVTPGVDLLPAASAAIAGLRESHMLVQGPPGSGKTYLSAHAIVDLLKAGKRIGVASNSHKAINNLLMEVEQQALARGITFRGAKKCSGDEDYLNGAMIVDVERNEDISDGHYDLVGGTAWLFARPEFDREFDYLFIEEAGQVALANVIAMGVSARNIVLVGDQMQLAQPAQGVHPKDSGKSALEFLLGELATVAPDRGIFLPLTRRMHTEVCRFISDAVYDGRLKAEPEESVQRLILLADADPALKPYGISWVPVAHTGCSQRSEPEGERIRELYASLLQQRWIDRKGDERSIGPGEILVVTPYNMQVNHLRTVLPAGARIGTVDKFQGQEAAVVLVSMTSSSAEDISRGIDFLYSRNRLNVAVSRAKCLALVVASPTLLEARCNSIEQLKLVNTLCFVSAYSRVR